MKRTEFVKLCQLYKVEPTFIENHPVYKSMHDNAGHAVLLVKVDRSLTYNELKKGPLWTDLSGKQMSKQLNELAPIYKYTVRAKVKEDMNKNLSSTTSAAGNLQKKLCWKSWVYTLYLFFILDVHFVHLHSMQKEVITATFTAGEVMIILFCSAHCLWSQQANISKETYVCLNQRICWPI